MTDNPPPVPPTPESAADAVPAVGDAVESDKTGTADEVTSTVTDASPAVPPAPIPGAAVPPPPVPDAAVPPNVPPPVPGTATGVPTGYPQQPPAYGQQPPVYGQPAGAYGPKTNTMAVVGLVLSLVGIVTIITAPIGAILGHVALGQVKRTGEGGRPVALAAVIIGWIVTALWVIGIAISVIFTVWVFANIAGLRDAGF